MRTVSACACARVQSRLKAAAAAAEVFSSVLREVGIASSPEPSFSDWLLLSWVKYFDNTPESQHRRSHHNGVSRPPAQSVAPQTDFAARAIAATALSNSK